MIIHKFNNIDKFSNEEWSQITRVIASGGYSALCVRSCWHDDDGYMGDCCNHGFVASLSEYIMGWEVQHPDLLKSSLERYASHGISWAKKILDDFDKEIHPTPLGE